MDEIDKQIKRLDRIDKMEIDLANYEQMERDIEKIIEPYQTEIEAEAFSLPTAIESILERKEQECEEINLTNERLVDEKYKLNEQIHQLKFENKVLKQYKSSKQASYEEIQNLWNIVELKNRKLSQTITEIKEIAEDESYVGFWDEQISKILQKISEVENDNV